MLSKHSGQRERRKEGGGRRRKGREGGREEGGGRREKTRRHDVIPHLPSAEACEMAGRRYSM
eukprot:4580454-Pyramimonas_sp.AAC.1